MVIDGFDEILNTVYIAKRLYDMGKYEVAAGSFYDVLECDVYYENMYCLIEDMFAYHDCRYYERYGIEVHVLSDPVVVDFYTLAGEYGRLHKIPDADNPYIKEAGQEAGRLFGFSYSIDWKLMVHTEAKRPYHSRIGIFLYTDDWIDPGYLAYGLVEMYGWFSDACTRLRDVLHKDGTAALQFLGEEVAA